jgi:hypothetical protein
VSKVILTAPGKNNTIDETFQTVVRRQWCPRGSKRALAQRRVVRPWSRCKRWMPSLSLRACTWRRCIRSRTIRIWLIIFTKKERRTISCVESSKETNVVIVGNTVGVDWNRFGGSSRTVCPNSKTVTANATESRPKQMFGDFKHLDGEYGYQRKCQFVFSKS